jgi:hypothetical protein
MTDWDTQVVVRLALLPALRAFYVKVQTAPMTPLSFAIAAIWLASVLTVLMYSIPKDWWWL